MALHRIVLNWSDAAGFCYECGLPAAFAVAEPDEPVIEAHHKRCAVCAANDAVDGQHIIRILDLDAAIDREEQP